MLGFQQLLWNPFNWSSMKIWGVQLKFTSQAHPDFIKDLIFLYLPIKYIRKRVCVCINQYLLDNWFLCCFDGVFFLKEPFLFSLWRMSSALCMQWELEWTICGRSFPLPLAQDGIWSTQHPSCFPLLFCILHWLCQAHHHPPMAWVRTGEAQDGSLGAWCNGSTMVSKNWGLAYLGQV